VVSVHGWLVDGHSTYIRAEAGRMLLAATGRRGITSGDGAYLVRLIAARTGIGQPDAERGVDDAIAGVTTAVQKARRSSAFLLLYLCWPGLLRLRTHHASVDGIGTMSRRPLHGAGHSAPNRTGVTGSGSSWASPGAAIGGGRMGERALARWVSR